MRKLTLPLFAVVAVIAFVAMDRPPVEQLVEGQHQCGTAVCMGTKTNAVKLQGPVSFETPGAVPFTPNPDGGPSTLTTANNYVGSSTKALINWDFPPLINAIGSLQTADSVGVTIGSCPFGSQLSLGMDQAMPAGGTVVPYLSAANTVFGRASLQIFDGGTFNLPDASYLVRCTQ